MTLCMAVELAGGYILISRGLACLARSKVTG